VIAEVMRYAVAEEMYVYPAPHSEQFHKTIGAAVGMVDRLRDKLTGRNTG
jgi:hypothetical protein